jgi:putrescine aminotransferase
MENLSVEEKRRIVEETIEKYMKYLNPGLARLYKFANLTTVEWKGEGAKVFDIFGEAYIDCIGGFGVFNVGRNHPRVVERVIEQLRRLPLSSRTLFNKHQADLAEMLAAITPGDLQYSFFCNSGAEGCRQQAARRAVSPLLPIAQRNYPEAQVSG